MSAAIALLIGVIVGAAMVLGVYEYRNRRNIR